MRKFRVVTICLLSALFAAGPLWEHARAQQAGSDGTSGSSDDAETILLPVENRPAPIVTSNHLAIENYDSGAVKLRREVNVLSDESWVNHGRFAEFYKSGQKFAEGRYENGARDGEWTYWYENGKTCKTVQYREGVPHGAWTVFREDGTRKAARQYVNGEPQGTWATYAEDGETVLKEENYQDGLAHGKWIQRFASGKPHIEEDYQRGKRHGKYVERDEQGQVVREMEFKEGRLDGRLVIRAAGGREIVQHYRDGQLLPDGPASGSE